jgi:DNA-binding response OmpR family regulator
MQILVLGDDRPDVPTIINAIRLGRLEVLAPNAGEAAFLPDDGRYAFAAWTLDTARRSLFDTAGRPAELTSSEFDLLLAFLRRPGEVISRADLTRAIRGRTWDYFDRSIDTLVARLRKKIDAADGPSLLRSVRGVGYVFCAPVARPVAIDH